MRNSPARWASVVAAAALIALPVAASAQTQPPATPPTQQTTPQTPPAQPPADPTPADPKPAEPQAQPPQDAKVDAAAAKEHLGQARDSLSKLASLPEAAKLDGDARTQVSQLISNFNELITTQADWRAAYAKVDGNLTTLLGPASANQPPAATGVTGAVGTSGSGVQLDPAIRGKLTEFRTHLKEFERAAGGGGAMAPSAATDATASPANPTPASPASAATPPPSANPPAPANPPTPMITSSPTTTMAPADQAKATDQAGPSEAAKHLDAIDQILNESKTGALTKAQTTELKKHVDELRQILKKK